MCVCVWVWCVHACELLAISLPTGKECKEMLSVLVVSCTCSAMEEFGHICDLYSAVRWGSLVISDLYSAMGRVRVVIRDLYRAMGESGYI